MRDFEGFNSTKIQWKYTNFKLTQSSNGSRKSSIPHSNPQSEDTGVKENKNWNL